MNFRRPCPSSHPESPRHRVRPVNDANGEQITLAVIGVAIPDSIGGRPDEFERPTAIMAGWDYRWTSSGQRKSYRIVVPALARDERADLQIERGFHIL